MKYLVLILVTTGLLLSTSCSAGVEIPKPQNTLEVDTSTGVRGISYYHDDIHDVGIWYNWNTGSIAILPDSGYKGEPEEMSKG